MRVISGTCKGMPLRAVSGLTTRPTTDKVKESLFNIIGPYFDGGIVLDLFAGSGGLGIEALSRGADKVYFVEKDRQVVRMLQQNLDFCQLTAQAKIMKLDALRCAQALVATGCKFNYLLIDPPYKIAAKIPDIVSHLAEAGLLAGDCLIICEHGEETTLPAEIGERFKQFRQTKYGITRLSFYRG